LDWGGLRVKVTVRFTLRLNRTDFARERLGLAELCDIDQDEVES
jgi:hypothetical protein